MSIYHLDCRTPIVPSAPTNPTAVLSAGASPSRQRPLLVFVVLGLALAASFGCDDAVRELVLEHPNAALKKLANWMSDLSNGYLILPSCLAGAIGGWACRSARWMKLALALLMAFALAGVVVNGVRALSGRTRPNARTPQGWYGLRYQSRWIAGRYEFSSFPSGHTGAAFGLVGVLFLGTRRARLPAAVYGFMVGWARIYMDYHHFSDVVAGAVVGLGTAYLTWHKLVPPLLRRIPPRRAQSSTGSPSIGSTGSRP